MPENYCNAGEPGPGAYPPFGFGKPIKGSPQALRTRAREGEGEAALGQSDGPGRRRQA